jgi:hypothetical protein
MVKLSRIIPKIEMSEVGGEVVQGVGVGICGGE